MIIIDNRENSLIHELRQFAIDYEISQLELGDVIVKNNDHEFLIERKSLKDLEQSIKDGRYKEQKSRLSNSKKKYFYIIENYTGFSDLNSICTGAIINSTLRDNILIMYSKSIKDTAKIIYEFHNRFLKDSSVYICDSNPKKEDYDETICVFTKKSDNNSPSNVYIRQLCVVPGISYKKAKVIIIGTNTSTLYDLVRKIKEENFKLSTLPNIGNKLEKTICHYLL